MQDTETRARNPLQRLSEKELKESLRGFPAPAIQSTLALREDLNPANLEACLFELFLFYLPEGVEVPGQMPPAAACQLREDLGIDSLSLSEAMFKFEEIFDIRVENPEIGGVKTLADASRLLIEKLRAETSEM